jgi:4-phytase/acid phosphatase
MLAAAGPDGLDTPATREAMTELQAIVAPDGCKGGKGYCFTGDDTIGDTPAGPRIQGPLSISASLAEDLLLEYAEDMPMSQVGWGRVHSEHDIAVVMAAHQQAFGTLRYNTYLAARQGSRMARMIVAALNGSPSGSVPGPQYGPASKVVVFSGHDTNVAFMGAVFGLDWALPGEPDVTSPAETLALELWADPATGRRYVRPVIYYETLDQLRTLSPSSARELPLRFDGCADGRDGACSLAEVTRRVEALIPPGCGEI